MNGTKATTGIVGACISSIDDCFAVNTGLDPERSFSQAELRTLFGCRKSLLFKSQGLLVGSV